MVSNTRPPHKTTFKLICTYGNAPEKEVRLEKLPLVVGRGPDTDLRLNDRWVSRRNCELYDVGGVLWVRDLGSANGILVNDQPVVESHLMPGDELTVGMTTFVVAYGDEPPATPRGGSTLVLREAAALAMRVASQLARKHPK